LSFGLHLRLCLRFGLCLHLRLHLCLHLPHDNSELDDLLGFIVRGRRLHVLVEERPHSRVVSHRDTNASRQARQPRVVPLGAKI
jgi:hypothetical protein